MRWICSLPLLLLPACEKSDKPELHQELSLKVPAKFKIHQRSSQEMPGSGDQLLITIDDITRGQVMTQIAPSQGEALVAMRSLREGDLVEFTYKGDDYVLLLKQLTNLLMGSDYAEFWLKAKGGEFEAMTEVDVEVRQLLQALESEDGLVMIRNGEEHSAKEGVTHLAMKFEHQKNRIQSAEEFIEEVASESSTSGKAYLIRFKDGTTMTTKEWLSKKLETLRKDSE